MFVHLFFGPANFAAGVDSALAPFDNRSPRLTGPRFAGLSLDPGVTAQVDFSIPIPANVEPSNYIGNSFLVTATWHDPGQYIDRSMFVFQMTCGSPAMRSRVGGGPRPSEPDGEVDMAGASPAAGGAGLTRRGAAIL